VPLEALLCGTPVVVCSDSGCGEVIGRVGGGHIVPHGNVAALAGAIDAILASPDTWRARAARAGERTRSLCGSQVVAQQLEAVYEAVVREAATGARGTA
jgi:glycosyltransferase involved in cell wall biosynthesis